MSSATVASARLSHLDVESDGPRVWNDSSTEFPKRKYKKLKREKGAAFFFPQPCILLPYKSLKTSNDSSSQLLTWALLQRLNAFRGRPLPTHLDIHQPATLHQRAAKAHSRAPATGICKTPSHPPGTYPPTPAPSRHNLHK